MVDAGTDRFPSRLREGRTGPHLRAVTNWRMDIQREQGAPETLAAELYVGREAYERERKAIFARTWLFLGHESQLPEPGSVIAATIAGFPMLAVRDEREGLRGYHNVCRHRAGPLAYDGESRCGARL